MSSVGKKREVWRMRSVCWKSCGKGPRERAAAWTVRFAIPYRNKIFSFLQDVEGPAEPPDMKLSIDLHLVLRLKMGGVVFLPHFPFIV